MPQLDSQAKPFTSGVPSLGGQSQFCHPDPREGSKEVTCPRHDLPSQNRTPVCQDHRYTNLPELGLGQPFQLLFQACSPGFRISGILRFLHCLAPPLGNPSPALRMLPDDPIPRWTSAPQGQDRSWYPSPKHRARHREGTQHRLGFHGFLCYFK